MATARVPRDQPEEDKENERDNDNPDDNKEPDVEPTEVLGQDPQIKATPNTREEIRNTGMEKLSQLENDLVGLLNLETQTKDDQRRMDQ